MTPTGPNTREKESIRTSTYKLRSLSKQHDSGPEWMGTVKARGFIGENYVTLSRDNSPISIYHLINPLANQRTLYKYPVLIFHGIGSDAAQMIGHSELARPRQPIIGEIVVNPTDTALAFLLANNNFDVWMCDARGTNLNNHLVSDDLDLVQGPKYWNFTLDEQVHYDVPNIIDFVLGQTHEDKLHYVGFSESTFFMFALLSSQIEYQNKLASFTALAPVAYVEHITGYGLTLFAPSAMFPDYINGNYVPQLWTDTVSVYLRNLCQFKMFTNTICQLVASAVSGKGDNEQSRGFYGAAIKSTSIKTVKHFMQLYSQRRFGMYDHGVQGNLRQYGTPIPPSYNLGNIKLPSIVLMRGGNDFLSTHLDQQRLLRELGVKPYLDIYYPGYNHIDFIISRNVVREVNLPVVRAMFDWLREFSRQEGSPSILKDPVKASLPKPIKPVAVVFPDGSRQVDIKSNLVNNIINSVAEVAGQRVIDNDGGATLGSITPTEFKNQFSKLAGLGQTINSLPIPIKLPQILIA